MLNAYVCKKKKKMISVIKSQVRLFPKIYMSTFIKDQNISILFHFYSVQCLTWIRCLQDLAPSALTSIEQQASQPEGI